MARTSSIPYPITTSAPSSTRWRTAPPVGAVAVGRTGLDLLGGGKHDRRDRPCRRQGSRAVSHQHVGRRRRQCRWRATPAQHLARCDGPGGLRHHTTSEGRGDGRCLRLVTGKSDRKLDRMRGPCCRCAVRRGQGQEADRGHRRRHAGASRQYPCPGRGAALWGSRSHCTRRRR